MIALFENMVGMDNTVYVIGLNSCVALFAMDKNERIVGGHFTYSDPINQVNLMIDKMIELAQGKVIWGAMIGNYKHWKGATSGLTNEEKIKKHFEEKLNILITSYNFTKYGFYDIKCFSSGFSTTTPYLYYRQTPNPNPSGSQDSLHVFKLNLERTSLVLRRPHAIPTNLDGFHIL